MDKAAGSTSGKIGRRLNMVKVFVDLLNHELDLNKADRSVNLDRDRLDAAVGTLELFIEDVEGLLRAGGGVEDKSKIIEQPRGVAASRLS